MNVKILSSLVNRYSGWLASSHLVVAKVSPREFFIWIKISLCMNLINYISKIDEINPFIWMIFRRTQIDTLHPHQWQRFLMIQQ